MLSMKYNYQAFGLKITSEIEIPVFVEVQDDEPCSADVVIQLGKVPEVLSDANQKRVFAQMKKGEFLFYRPAVARYLVKDGNLILIEPLSDEYSDLIIFLTCSVFGALFHQRGLLALHSSVIKTGEFCAAFCGDSRAGKSTLAKALLNKGYHLQSDDLGVIWPERLNDHGVPMLYPSCPRMKLWIDALRHSGEDEVAFSRLRPQVEKYSVPVNEQYYEKPLPVGKIYVLEYDDVKEPDLIPVRGVEKIHMLRNQTYRFKYLDGLRCQVNHFKSVSSLALEVDVVRLVRPRGFEYMPSIIDCLETDFKKWN